MRIVSPSPQSGHTGPHNSRGRPQILTWQIDAFRLSCFLEIRKAADRSHKEEETKTGVKHKGMGLGEIVL
jgi:hypothetical protein